VTYRTILVHLDQEPLCASRTRTAIHLARDLDCRLIGLAPTGLLDLPVSPQAAGSLADFAGAAWDSLRESAALAVEQFKHACEAAGLKSYEAVMDEADTASSLVYHAHCSDLAVLSQPDPQGPGHRQAQVIVEEVVLQSARPTLVIPYAGRFDTPGRNVMVAWDDSREAARAVSDALPLLRRAAQVQVVSWNEAGNDADTRLNERMDALRQWLMWQGVPAETRVETTAVSISDAMLSRAADLGADLVVMGAYGHSRWAERVLGGATRGLLTSMTVPVLMSH
jgi:nucleotide-binding universal stress UspA family protein